MRSVGCAGRSRPNFPRILPHTKADSELRACIEEYKALASEVRILVDELRNYLAQPACRSKESPLSISKIDLLPSFISPPASLENHLEAESIVSASSGSNACASISYRPEFVASLYCLFRPTSKERHNRISRVLPLDRLTRFNEQTSRFINCPGRPYRRPSRRTFPAQKSVSVDYPEISVGILWTGSKEKLVRLAIQC